MVILKMPMIMITRSDLVRVRPYKLKMMTMVLQLQVSLTGGLNISMLIAHDDHGHAK